MIEGIISAVTIPVMAKVRIGHFVEAQILQSLGVDYIDESEVLTPADYTHHIDKWKFTVPFVCGRPTSVKRCVGSARARP
ncbi:SOR/SNZ family protein [Mycobacterium kansasii]|uniref:SOR/SNZ family protein n=1 Tax=Mycobacterium kansasii TaxID=1768 RepID=A0A1V3W969_MYCKA|nr:SOR/SNZ family protein [Mycobacterium kansasii]